MAKIRGIAGGINGRAGEMVFSKGDNGTTIMKKYQPVVRNPRTNGQLSQRAKMNCVGQFVGLCSNALLSPLAMGSNRMNRADLSSRLLKAASVTRNNGNFIASFPPSAVKFAHGNQPALTAIDSVIVEGSKVTITATPNVEADMLNKYGDRFILGIMSDNTNTLYDGVIFLDHVVTTNTSQTIVMDLNQPLDEGQTIVVWRVPFVLNNGTTSVNGQNIYIGDAAISAAISANSNALVAHWGDTYVVEIVPFSEGQ